MLRKWISQVGAGLPVVGPVQSLVRAGDEVETASGPEMKQLSHVFAKVMHPLIESNGQNSARPNIYQNVSKMSDI